MSEKNSWKPRKWYEEEKTGLGDDFKQNVNTAIVYIGNNPHHFLTRHKELRLSLVRRFPYVIYFLIDDDLKIIMIFAVLHMRRNPEVARIRLK